MYVSEAWEILGLEPTVDKRMVKRAYAAQLKAIDPDKQMAQFLLLRSALETALLEAESHQHDEAEDAHSIEKGGEAAKGTAPPPVTHTSVSPDIIEEFWKEPAVSIEGQQDETIDVESVNPDIIEEFWKEPATSVKRPQGEATHTEAVSFDKLEKALFNYTSENTEPEYIKKLLVDFLKGTAMQNIEFAQDAEPRLAELLLSHQPYSDPLILIADQHFGWSTDHGDILATHIINQISRVGCDLKVIEYLKDPNHEWHHAYSHLADPNSVITFKDRLSLRLQMAELLGSLERFNYNILLRFDQEKLTDWQRIVNVDDQSDTQESGINWITVFIIISIILFKVISYKPEKSSIEIPDNFIVDIKNP